MCGVFFEGTSVEGLRAYRALKASGLSFCEVGQFGEDQGPPILKIGELTLVGLAEIAEYCKSKQPSVASTLSNLAPV